MKKLKNIIKVNKAIQRCVLGILILTMCVITQAKAQTSNITVKPGHAVITIGEWTGLLGKPKKMKLLYDGSVSWVDLDTQLKISPKSASGDVDYEYILLMAGLNYMDKQGYDLASTLYKKSTSSTTTETVLIFSLRKN